MSGKNHAPMTLSPLLERATIALNKNCDRMSDSTVNFHSMESSTDSNIALWEKVTTTYTGNSLLFNLVLAIGLAFLYPPLGGVYLHKEITSDWIAIVIIFFISGFTIRVDQMAGAIHNIKFILVVQAFNMLLISATQRFLGELLLKTAMEPSLVMGMIICSCLPLPTNMTLILTASSKGDEALAIINSTIGNLAGVFISPLLVLLYLNQSTHIDVARIYTRICLRVLVPLSVGITVRSITPGADSIALQYKHLFHAMREAAMIFIVFCLFSDTFLDPPDIRSIDLTAMAMIQFLLLIVFKALAWLLIRSLFYNDPRAMRVTGLFCCTQKTVALGIPLINAMFEDSPYLGIYSLPLLAWYISQFLLGSFLAPKLRNFVENEDETVLSFLDPNLFHPRDII